MWTTIKQPNISRHYVARPSLKLTIANGIGQRPSDIQSSARSSEAAGQLLNLINSRWPRSKTRISHFSSNQKYCKCTWTPARIRLLQSHVEWQWSKSSFFESHILKLKWILSFSLGLRDKNFFYQEYDNSRKNFKTIIFACFLTDIFQPKICSIV